MPSKSTETPFLLSAGGWRILNVKMHVYEMLSNFLMLYLITGMPCQRGLTRSASLLTWHAFYAESAKFHQEGRAFSWYFSSQSAGKPHNIRTPSPKTQSDSLHAVITNTLTLWRRHHLTYDQTRYVAQEVRRALALARPAVRQRVIVRLSRAEEQGLIAQGYRMPGVRGLLMKTLFQTGARVSEFVHLRVEDVFFNEQMLLIVKAKGGKSRYVPLLPALTQELRTYLRDRPTGYLFETRRHTRYSPRRIQQLVQETAALAGITKRVYPHLLRHSVATTLLEQGMPLEQIRKFLGHAKLETTQVYAESTTAMIKESYQQALAR